MEFYLAVDWLIHYSVKSVTKSTDWSISGDLLYLLTRFIVKFSNIFSIFSVSGSHAERICPCTIWLNLLAESSKHLTSLTSSSIESRSKKTKQKCQKINDFSTAHYIHADVSFVWILHAAPFFKK